MQLPGEMALEFEKATIAKVVCRRCGEAIGRLEAVLDSETGSDAEVRRREVQGEIDVIVKEHANLCPEA